MLCGELADDYIDSKGHGEELAQSIHDPSWGDRILTQAGNNSQSLNAKDLLCMRLTHTRRTIAIAASTSEKTGGKKADASRITGSF
jgi:hypothetical protein